MTEPGVPRWRPGQPVEPLRELIARGGVLAIPTESSYGLAVDPRNREAVSAVFSIKRRPAERPLPIVVADLLQIRELGGQLPEELEAPLAELWPAAVTVLLPFEGRVPAAAGSDRLGFRIPAHEMLLRLLAELGHGLSATSANVSGSAPVLEPDGLDELLRGADAVIVDGGRLAGGSPSTVVGWRDGQLEVVRPGSVTVDKLISFSAPSVEISVEDAS